MAKQKITTQRNKNSIEKKYVKNNADSAHNAIIDSFADMLEFECNMDMNTTCSALSGCVEVNQISANSRICVPENTEFTTVKKDIDTSISYEKNRKAEDFNTADSENVIELNGMKNGLVIWKNDLSGNRQVEC